MLYEQMVQMHPQLEGVGITHAWGGNVALTVDRMPHFGKVDGVTYAIGCNGTGVALAMVRPPRRRVDGGDEDPPAFADLRFRPIPFRTVPRRWWLPLAGQPRSGSPTGTDDDRRRSGADDQALTAAQNSAKAST